MSSAVPCKEDAVDIQATRRWAEPKKGAIWRNVLMNPDFILKTFVPPLKPLVFVCRVAFAFQL